MENKGAHGRAEEILEPELPIIDAHHHLRDRPDSHYLLDDYLADVGAGHNVVASVYVESKAMARADGREVLRPLGEVEFANGMAAISSSGKYGPCRVAAAIVGFADLTKGEAVAELLDRACAAAPDRFRGIRQVTLEHQNPVVWKTVAHPPPSGVMAHPEFAIGFKKLAAHGLSFDTSVFHHQLPELSRLAQQFPDTDIILNHFGGPAGVAVREHERPAVFEEWRANMRALAKNPNVYCKVGGLGLPFNGFGLESREDETGYLELAEVWRPWVESSIEIFGSDRCMMESNFPADAQSCGFVPLWNALKHITIAASSSEKAALFHGTAARAYRIDPVV